MLRFRFRAHHEDDMTPAQHDQLLMTEVAGESEGVSFLLTRRHLEFARHLVEHGRIGEDDQPTPEMLERAFRIPGERPR